MSKKGMPTLPWVLPMYEHMKMALKTTITMPTTLVPLAYAAQAGLAKLEYYHAMAKDCQYNKLAASKCIFS